MERRSADEDETYALPKRRYQSEVKSVQMFGCQMIVFNESKTHKTLSYIFMGELTSVKLRFSILHYVTRLPKRQTQL
ncbi:MAG: hypothetical protein IKF13_04020 [Methanobrevibacter sp.]|nr:hypothetical protein [Methanobrevibacter sp.]